MPSNNVFLGFAFVVLVGAAFFVAGPDRVISGLVVGKELNFDGPTLVKPDNVFPPGKNDVCDGGLYYLFGTYDSLVNTPDGRVFSRVGDVDGTKLGSCYQLASSGSSSTQLEEAAPAPAPAAAGTVATDSTTAAKVSTSGLTLYTMNKYGFYQRGGDQVQPSKDLEGFAAFLNEKRGGDASIKEDILVTSSAGCEASSTGACQHTKGAGFTLKLIPGQGGASGELFIAIHNPVAKATSAKTEAETTIQLSPVAEDLEFAEQPCGGLYNRPGLTELTGPDYCSGINVGNQCTRTDGQPGICINQNAELDSQSRAFCICDAIGLQSIGASGNPASGGSGAASAPAEPVEVQADKTPDFSSAVMLVLQSLMREETDLKPLKAAFDQKKCEVKSSTPLELSVTCTADFKLSTAATPPANPVEQGKGVRIDKLYSPGSSFETNLEVDAKTGKLYLEFSLEQACAKKDECQYSLKIGTVDVIVKKALPESANLVRKIVYVDSKGKEAVQKLKETDTKAVLTVYRKDAENKDVQFEAEATVKVLPKPKPETPQPPVGTEPPALANPQPPPTGGGPGTAGLTGDSLCTGGTPAGVCIDTNTQTCSTTLLDNRCSGGNNKKCCTGTVSSKAGGGGPQTANACKDGGNQCVAASSVQSGAVTCSSQPALSGCARGELCCKVESAPGAPAPKPAIEGQACVGGSTGTTGTCVQWNLCDQSTYKRELAGSGTSCSANYVCCTLLESQSCPQYGRSACLALATKGVCTWHPYYECKCTNEIRTSSFGFGTSEWCESRSSWGLSCQAVLVDPTGAGVCGPPGVAVVQAKPG
ncbi:hypothetical protein HY572_04245 [Candidatus Micrarchaeota archaeon]|nr:hypothetical protein [Candidatus Micrarchaeota archaeon]